MSKMRVFYLKLFQVYLVIRYGKIVCKQQLTRRFFFLTSSPKIFVTESSRACMNNEKKYGYLWNIYNLPIWNSALSKC